MPNPFTDKLPDDRDAIRRWRLRAEECRTAADNMTSDRSRRNLLVTAESYDRMAENAEQRLAGARESPPLSGGPSRG